MDPRKRPNRTCKMGTSLEIALSLPEGRGKRRALEAALRAAVNAGRLQPGDSLPSTRSLAADLGVSRRLVVEAYEQLASEGYLRSHGRRGTVVASAARPLATPIVAEVDQVLPFLDDWLPGTPDLGTFPRKRWLALLRNAYASGESLGYPEIEGSPALRRTLAAYLRRVRSVRCDVDDVWICSGLSGALTLWAACLRRGGASRVAVEHPGPSGLADRLRRLDLDVVPVAVDQDGARISDLEGRAVDGVVLTPAHQFPRGAVLSPERRRALVGWARRSDAWVFEDDYDAEFRFDGQPVGSLQGLAPDRVATASSVSKTLAPGLRLGWMVLPRALRDLAPEVSLNLGQVGPHQEALSALIESGDYDRHIRKQRREYARRRQELGLLLDQYQDFSVLGARAGLHLAVEVSGGGWQRVDRLVAGAKQVKIGLASLGDSCWTGSLKDVTPGFLLGYAAIPRAQWGLSLRRLDALLGTHFRSQVR